LRKLDYLYLLGCNQKQRFTFRLAYLWSETTGQTAHFLVDVSYT